MSPAARGFGRRILAPEVIQSSMMDCGPAALKSVLAGYGVHVSYGRLREACHTDVDGTSIDTLEDLARTLGLDADQVLLPADWLALVDSSALPAIVVVPLSGGATHFVVVWGIACPCLPVPGGLGPARPRPNGRSKNACAR